VSGVVPDAVGLAYPVAVDQIGGDEIRERDARRVANGERCIVRLRGAFNTTVGGQTRAQAWQASLRTARQVGNELATAPLAPARTPAENRGFSM
jgi:hypothetical protein